MDATWKAGLEDVIAARSAICRVDGEAGRLYYRGYEIGELAGAVGFADVTALLWVGELPPAAEAAGFAGPPRGGRGPAAAGQGPPGPLPPAHPPPPPPRPAA